MSRVWSILFDDHLSDLRRLTWMIEVLGLDEVALALKLIVPVIP